nr:uncharacterized protein LOC109160987 isoform X1 [Ipomoea trifida]
MVEPVTIISGIVAAANSGVSILEKQGNGRKLNAEAAKTLAEISSMMGKSFPVLNGSNYEIWRKMMKALLISHNLWDVVEEGYREKGRKAKKDRVLDSMALLIILQAVDQSVLRCTVDANTSKEVWDAIQNKYQDSIWGKFGLGQVILIGVAIGITLLAAIGILGFLAAISAAIYAAISLKEKLITLYREQVIRLQQKFITLHGQQVINYRIVCVTIILAIGIILW